MKGRLLFLFLSRVVFVPCQATAGGHVVFGLVFDRAPAFRESQRSRAHGLLELINYSKEPLGRVGRRKWSRAAYWDPDIYIYAATEQR